MNKKFTLLAAALMTVSAFTVNAEETDSAIVPVDEKEWTAGNYYHLKSQDSYLALDGNKSDSVIVKALNLDEATKASIDSALWQISDKETALGVTTYKITNKATQDVLSFAAKADATTKLASGVDRWIIGNGKISGFYTSDKSYSLNVSTDNELSLKEEDGTVFIVEAPNSDFPLDAAQLGNGFSVFQLMFGDTYEGNIFEGKELLAKNLAEDEGYVSLQFAGDETFADGKAKLLGVDTTKTVISGAKGVYGAKFVADSTYAALTGVHSVGNKDFQKFKFTVNLKNDSIAMYVKAAPDVNGETLAPINNVRVVYAQTGATKVLTVSEADVLQGGLPKITAKRGTPVEISSGDGFYFLQSASKGANAGKYYVAYESGKGIFMGGDSVPVLEIPRGQWLVKENNGKYSIVDRESNTTLIWNQEVFAVKGMEDTYLIGQDSITLKERGTNSDINDAYLGSFTASEQELLDKGYILSLYTATPGVPELFMYTPDSILKGSAEEAAQLFKLYPVDTTVVAGAQELGDTISVIDYQLGGYFLDGKVAKDDDEKNEGGLKFSKKEEQALSFRFLAKPNSAQYSLITTDGKYVGIDINTSNLQLTTSTGTSVNIAPTDAPEYASFEAGHKRLTANGSSLVMNPLNFFAQAKTEGNEITKAAYEKDNFSLWVEPDTIVAGKQLYFISSAVGDTRYYMSFKDTTANNINADVYKNVMFLSNDTIKDSKNSPALFAFKVNEHGGYLLENQQQLKKSVGHSYAGYPYVGIVNGFVVLEKFPSTAFEVQTASAPTANEEVNVSEIKVISHDGQVIVANASGRMITLSNILGQTIGVRRANSEYFSMPATSGIILVTVEGDTTYKVIVK